MSTSKHTRTLSARSTRSRTDIDTHLTARKCTHINVRPDDLVAVWRCAETSASVYWLFGSSAPQPEEASNQEWSYVSVEMSVSRNIGNQFTCSVRARINMEVNIYSSVRLPE